MRSQSGSSNAFVTHNLTDFANAELRFPQIILCTPGQSAASQQVSFAWDVVIALAFLAAIPRGIRHRWLWGR